MSSLPLSAFGDVVFTVDPVEARSTLAHKAVDVVPAHGAVQTGLAHTLVHLALTSVPDEPGAAVTGETPHVIQTRTPVQTRVWGRERERERERDVET